MTNDMEITKFVDLVENMRQAQKNYFKTRDKKQMTRAIILEELVDKKIEAFKSQKPEPPEKGTLHFGE